MLGGDVGLAHLHGLAQRVFEDALRSGRERQARLARLPLGRFDRILLGFLGPARGDRARLVVDDADLAERLRRHALRLLDEPEQKEFASYFGRTQGACLVLSENQDMARLVGELFESHVLHLSVRLHAAECPAYECPAAPVFRFSLMQARSIGAAGAPFIMVLQRLPRMLFIFSNTIRLRFYGMQACNTALPYGCRTSDLPRTAARGMAVRRRKGARMRSARLRMRHGEAPLWKNRPQAYLASGRMCGNSSTSRMVSESVRSMTRRSMPTPTPPAGGIPYSSARM